MTELSEQRTQVRVPLERAIRDRVTERNKVKVPTRGVFYEGTQPRLVTVASVDNMTWNVPHFAFDLDASAKLCVHRFVDDIGLKVGTFACIDRLILNKYMDMTVKDCLPQYELYTEAIICKLKTCAGQYEDLISRCAELRGEKETVKHQSPWSS